MGVKTNHHNARGLAGLDHPATRITSKTWRISEANMSVLDPLSSCTNNTTFTMHDRRLFVTRQRILPSTEKKLAHLLKAEARAFSLLE